MDPERRTRSADAAADQSEARDDDLVDRLHADHRAGARLAAWVETGVAPAETTYAFVDGKVTLPRSASERGGVQPVVEVTANGAARAEAKIGEPVIIVAHAEAPPGAGTFTSAHWDLDASGRFAVDAGVAPGLSELTLSHTHVFDKPGTYFVTIARALIGKFAGDVAEVQAPGGVRELELIDVRYI